MDLTVSDLGLFLFNIRLLKVFIHFINLEMLKIINHNVILQGGQALWKTGKMVKKNSLQGKIREFEILLRISKKSGEFKKILSL